MNKMERKKKRLIAWVLCVVLIAANIMPSAEMQVFASEQETEETMSEDSFERDVELQETAVEETAVAETAMEEIAAEATDPVRKDSEENHFREDFVKSDGEGTLLPSAEMTREQEPGEDMEETRAENEQGDSDNAETLTQAESFVENETVTEVQVEELESVAGENESETKESGWEDLGAANTVEIGGSITLVDTTSTRPQDSQYKDLRVVYNWFIDNRDIADISWTDQICTVKGYKPGKVFINCKISITYQYYDSRLQTYRQKSYDVSGNSWNITVLGKDVTVTFDANGGSVNTSNKIVKSGETYGELPVPTRVDHTFLGWYTDAYGGTNVTSTTTVSKLTSHTLYAHWASHVAVTFDSNGGTPAFYTKTVVNTFTYGDLPTPTRSDYEFDGWYTEKSGGIQITGSTIVNASSSQTLYAHWLGIYTVTFDPNGGKTPLASKKVTHSRKYGELPTPTRSGYEFDGWYTAADGGYEKKSDTSAYLDGPQTLYAHWIRKYTVTFHPMGGSVPEESMMVTYGKPYGTMPIPVKSESGFVGWYTAPYGGIRVTSESIAEQESNLILYAHWKPAYNVVFNPNGGSVSLESKKVTQSLDYGALPIPEKDGYRFMGWYTEKEEGEQIVDTTIVKLENDQVLYAHWLKICKVSFNTNGGTGGPSLMTVTEGATVTVPFVGPSKVRENFGGWLYNGKTYYPGNNITVTEDVQLTAVWEDAYKVSINKAYTAKIPAAGVSVYYQLMGITGVTESGFGATYCYQSLGGRTSLGKAFKVITKCTYDTKNGIYDKTLFADNGDWTAYSNFKATGSYTVYLEIKAVDDSYGTVDFYVGETGIVQKQYPVYYKSNEGGIIDAGTASSETGELIAYKGLDVSMMIADASIKECIVTYDANGGISEKDSDIIAYQLDGWKDDDKYNKVWQAGETYSENAALRLTAQWTPQNAITLPKPVKEHYRFLGWYTGSEGGTQVEDGSFFRPNSILTLYAHWEPVSCTVTLDADGGSVFPNTVTVSYDDFYGELPVPFRKGYHFKGWHFSDTEGGALVDDTTIVRTEKDHTLYAVWEQDDSKGPFTVLFDTQEHGIAPAAYFNIIAGSTIEPPQDPIAEDLYQFLGWYKDAECTQKWNFAADTVLDDITLYAGWKIKEGENPNPPENPEEGKLVWNIDSQGKLTVKGTGDFAKPASGDADADFNRAPWYNDRKKIKSAQINVSGITDISYMFCDCENLTSIDLSGLDTSNVTNMAWIFNGCAQLRNLDLSSFNTTAVLDMTAMFNGCTGLENVNLSSFDTKNVTSMYGMFSGCENLTDLDVSSFDTRNVIDMRGTFSLCRKLKKLDLSHFDTGNVLSMRAMFSEDDLLEELVLSSFDTQNVFDMAYLFESCSSLTSLDLGGFDVSQVEDAENMLHGCNSLDKIIVPHHLNVPVALPKAKTTDIWYDMNETAYTDLPLGLSNGMVLQKNKKPEITEPHLTVTKLKTVYQQGEALNTDDIKVLYYDSNGSVITVSGEYDTNADTIDMSVAGEKTLTVSYKGVSASLIIIVREKEEQGNDPEWNVQLISHQTYTGKAIKPEVSVNAADGGALLRAGKDYTVKYFNNMNADITDLDGGISAAGTEGDNGFTKKLPYVVITGKGNYSGTIYQNFHIDAASIGDGKPAEGVTFKYKDQFVTSGKPQKPFQSLKCKKAMKAGTDFEITLEEVTLGEDGTIQARTPIDKGSTVPAIPAGAGGTFLMTVTGTGNYKGTIEAFVYAADKDHLMKNAKITLGKNIKSVPYEKEKPVTLTASEKPGENVFTVKFGKTMLNPENYTVSYTGNDAAGTATLTVTGKGEYIGTKSAAFKITGMPFSAKNISVSGLEASMAYTGKNLEQPGVVLKDGSTTLESGKQYRISYKNNRKKGTAAMIFTGNPRYGYSGSFKKTFKITAAPLGKNTVNVTAADYMVVSEGSGFRLEGEIVYTKSGTKPSGRITLTDVSGTVLQEGIDYTVSYQIPKDAADASMMIKGKGNYSGALTVYYTVGKAPLAQNQNLALLSVPAAFDSKKEGTYEYRPKLKITDGKKALSEGKDYTVVTYKNCTQQSVQAYLAALKSGAPDEELALLKPCAEITGAGNYTGNAFVPVTVYETKLAKKDIRIEISEGTAVYTGGKVKPEVTVYYQNQKLAEGRDYILTYGDNAVAGKNKGSVTVNGTGLYGGSVTQKFTILGRDIYTVKK